MTARPNAAQAEFWNTGAVRSWVELHEILDAQFAPLSQAALALLPVADGQRLLDIGCGCGADTFALAARAGSGAAVGVDISAPMLARARELAAQRGARNVAFVEADAQVACLAAGCPPFDAAFSRFGVMFFDDPPAAFANIRRSMRPGAPLAFVCWRRPDENPVLLAPYRAAWETFPVKPPKSDPLAPGPFAFADPARIRAILEQAGFRDVTVAPYDRQVGGQPFAVALELAMRIGPLAGVLREQPEATTAAREKVAAMLRRHERDGAVWLDAAVWLVTARA